MKKKVIVIGAGASGLIAAVVAARNNHHVMILEKRQRSGKKILLTGNGRCNLTNENVSANNYFSGPVSIPKQHPKFVESTFSRFSQTDTIRFFEELGLMTFSEPDGRIFPRSNQAQSVVDVLLFELERLNVPIVYNKEVTSIQKKNKLFEVTCSTQKQYTADVVVLAVGGKSYPVTGSTGDGYTITQSLGHTIIPPTESSVPIRVKSQLCQKLQGVKPEVAISISDSTGKILISHSGTLMFAHFGLSGPVIMESSRGVGKFFKQHPDNRLYISINFFPEYSKEKLDQLIINRFEQQPHKSLSTVFVGMLISKIAPAIFDVNGIDKTMPVSSVTKELRNIIVHLLTAYKEEILGTMGWDLAQFTAGGVDIKEINSQTMESKIVPGLFLCGEVVDIDGECGGYNLQWAWSSGYVAGSSI